MSRTVQLLSMEGKLCKYKIADSTENYLFLKARTDKDLGDEYMPAEKQPFVVQNIISYCY